MPTFDTPNPILATVEPGVGRLTINATARTDTVVEVHPTNRASEADIQMAEQTRVELVNGQVSVRPPKKKTLRSLIGRTPSVDVTIDLPTDSRVEAKVWFDVRSTGRLGDSTIETAAGSIHLDETGRLKAHTAAGEVSAARSAGPTDVSSSSGKIRLGRVDGSLVAKTSNGDITLGEVTGDVRLKTANGSIAVDHALGAVDARTAFGSVRVGEVVRGTVVLETSFGELEAGIREGTAAWLDVSSDFGNVRNELDESDAPESTDDSVEVWARTKFGDVVIRRAVAAA